MDFFLCSGSVYTVVAITVERYTTLRQIHKVAGLGILGVNLTIFLLQRPLKGKFLIFFIIFFSVSYNFVKFFELTVDVTVSAKYYIRCVPYITLFKEDNIDHLEEDTLEQHNKTEKVKISWLWLRMIFVHLN